VVWRGDSLDRNGIAGTDVFDLPCPNAQRLFSTSTKESRGFTSVIRGLLLLALLIATITFPRWNLCLSVFLSILRKRATNIRNFVESPFLISSHKAFVCTGINQLTMTFRRFLRHSLRLLKSVGFLYSRTP
jgi:hypothetical protein